MLVLLRISSSGEWHAGSFMVKVLSWVQVHWGVDCDYGGCDVWSVLYR